jgi:hypothetical protein
MFESSPARWTVIMVVGFLLVGILIGYATIQPAPELGDYADTDDVISAKSTYVGDKISVSGTVVSTNPIQVRLTTPSGLSHTLTVEGVDQIPTQGDRLRVHGRLADEDTVVALATTTKQENAYVRVRVLSGVAGLWVLYRLLQDWEIRPLLLRVSEGSTIKRWQHMIMGKE